MFPIADLSAKKPSESKPGDLVLAHQYESMLGLIVDADGHRGLVKLDEESNFPFLYIEDVTYDFLILANWSVEVNTESFGSPSIGDSKKGDLILSGQTFAISTGMQGYNWRFNFKGKMLTQEDDRQFYFPGWSITHGEGAAKQTVFERSPAD